MYHELDLADKLIFHLMGGTQVVEFSRNAISHLELLNHSHLLVAKTCG